MPDNALQFLTNYRDAADEIVGLRFVLNSIEQMELELIEPLGHA